MFNRALFAALRVEKLLLTAILGLVFLVVAYNVLQGLRRRVLERGMEIGLAARPGCAAVGAVRAVFIWEGALLGLLGAGRGHRAGVADGIQPGGAYSRMLEAVANSALAVAAVLPGIGAARAAPGRVVFRRGHSTCSRYRAA